MFGPLFNTLATKLASPTGTLHHKTGRRTRRAQWNSLIVELLLLLSR